MSDEQTLTPLLGDEDSTASAPRRLPIIAILALLLLASAALGGLAYLTGKLVNRPAGESPDLVIGPSSIPPPPAELLHPEGIALDGNGTIEADPAPIQPDTSGVAPTPAVPADSLDALREQVRALSERVSELGNRFQEQADERADAEQRIKTLEQLLESAKQDQEALAQRVESQAKRLDANVIPRPAAARSPGSAGSAKPPASPAASTARPPFTVLGVDQWGGVAQISISRAAGPAWLAVGESLEGWQVLAIHGREVIWRAPSGQTVTQQIGGA